MKHSILLLLLTGSLSLPAMAANNGPAPEKMDSETQNLVIEKIERVLSMMDPKDPSQLRASLRLADLLSERARLRFMNEVEANCQGCKGSVEDRKRAIGMYEAALPRLQANRRGAALMQMAQLHQIADQPAKAQKIYEDILKQAKLFGADLTLQARMGLADMLFQQNKHKEALAQYQIIFANNKAPSRGLVLYRIAWSQFNLDKLSTAIKTMEKLATSPKLMTKQMADGSVVADAGFQGDVLRDLGTFYARQKISSREIQKYNSWAPVDQRKALLLFFAEEANRVGQKQAAGDIYKLYLGLPDLTPQEKLDAQVMLAQISYDKGLSSESIQAFAVAAEAFKNTRCQDDQKCVELQKRMKHYVTELHRSKKTKLDNDLLKAYSIYAKTFPEDTEMAIRGAQVGDSINQFGLAVLLYSHAADSATDEKLRDLSLLGQIETAEKSGDVKMREEAYRHYLSLRPQGPKAFEARYQLAQLSVEKKDYSSAADQFRALALDSKGPAELRKKSADLALDSLALQKRDEEIQVWAVGFAEVFPKARLEYLTIARKALMAEVARIANDANSSRGDLSRVLKKSRAANLAGATDSEKQTHYRNQEILAGKVGDDEALMASFAGLLSLKSLSAKDKEEVLARKVGHFEKKLDFKSAYVTARQMKFPGLKTAERELRMATLADLAGMKSEHHYRASLRAGLSGSKEISVRARLVALSKNSLGEWKKQKNQLARDRGVWGDTLLLVFGRTRNAKALSADLNNPRFRNLPAVIFIQKQPFYVKHQVMAAKWARHQLSDKRLQATIQQRVKILKEIDGSLSEALRLKDHTAQVMALTSVKTENERMVRDLAALPMPKGLTPAEQSQYTELLKQRSRPYLVKSKMSEQKLNELWANESVLQRFEKDYVTSATEVRPMLANEIRLLANLAPNGSLRSRLNDIVDDSLPGQRDLLSARQSVSQHPEDRGEIEKLKVLETKIGHPLMSSYLDGRLGQIQKEKVL